MLGIDCRTARIAWTVILIAAALGLVYAIRRTLVVFICALLLAYLLAPFVEIADHLTRRKLPRVALLAMIYILLIVTAVQGIGSVGQRVAMEAHNLQDRLPQYLENPQIPVPLWLEPYRDRLLLWIRSELGPEGQHVLPVVQRAGQQILSMLTNLVFVVLVPIMSFFLLKDSGSFRDLLLDQLPPGPQRLLFHDILNDIHDVLAVYVRALVLLGLITFVTYWIFLGAVGAPYSATLALLAGMLEFIPAAGPLTASVTIFLVCGFAGFEHLVLLVGFLVIYRLALDYAILPLVMGAGISLPPLAIIFGVLAGEQIGGVMGMFLSIPALATLRVIYLQYRKIRVPAV